MPYRQKAHVKGGVSEKPYVCSLHSLQKKTALLPEVAVVAAVVVGGTENELMKYEHMFVDMSEKCHKVICVENPQLAKVSVFKPGWTRKHL